MAAVRWWRRGLVATAVAGAMLAAGAAWTARGDGADGAAAAASEGEVRTMRAADIHIRDPFVVPVAAERRYYLFGTTDPESWVKGNGIGFDYYTSTDLQTWEGPKVAFRPPEGFWADSNFWAPEVHFYRGRWYLFASFKAEGVCRGTQVLASDGGPGGPYRPHSEGPVTPREWECLDGTLYVDPAGAPWMVFCHEWVQVRDGEMCAVRLSPDLRTAVGEPVLLFRASAPAWVRPYDDRGDYVTDGPFLHRLASGGLIMLWATFGAGGYAEAVARSENGDIGGPWTHDAEPLFANDGGHGMLFRTFEGRLMLTLHRPNCPPDERAVFLAVRETGTGVVLEEAG